MKFILSWTRIYKPKHGFKNTLGRCYSLS